MKVFLLAAAILFNGALASGQTTVPILDNIDPHSAIQGTTLNLVLTGSWFTPTSRVTFSGSGVVVQSVRFVSSTSVVATIVLSARAGDY